MKNYKYTTGIIVCLFLIFFVITGIILYIPHMNFPTKVTANLQTDIVTMETNEKIGGSLHSGNLWNYYYGKTKEEVEAIAPMFMPFEGGLYRLDRSFLNEEKKEGLTDVMCMFDNNTLQVLSIDMQLGNEICGFDGKYKYNENDFSFVFDAGLASLVLMGLETGLDEENLENQIFPTDDKTRYFITTNDGVICSFETCPGSIFSFTCLKDTSALERIFNN